MCLIRYDLHINQLFVKLIFFCKYQLTQLMSQLDKIIEVILKTLENASDSTTSDQLKKYDKLMKMYFLRNETKTNIEYELLVLMRAFECSQNEPDVLVQLGLKLIHMPLKCENVGYKLLQRAFELNDNRKRIPIDTYQGKWIASIIGKYNVTIDNYITARKYFELAMSSSFCKEDDINRIQCATLVTQYPLSVKHAKQEINRYIKDVSLLLSKDRLNISFTNKDYEFIIQTAFNFELYYEADLKECMQKHYQLVTRVFPEYNYISTHLRSTYEFKSKHKIGIASGFYKKHHSVSSDFGGVIERLPTDIFDVTLIYICDSNNSEQFMYPDRKHIIIYTDVADWLQIARIKIENEQFDLLLYLDSTMSTHVHRLMMSKLAKKQAVSHGHPVTTGIPPNIMNYYISWEEAELETAHHHYSEQLVLLKKGFMHQYYEPRINSDGISTVSGKTYTNINREYFSELDPTKNWYVCMQRPFKLHPEFDNMIQLIVKKDPNAIIILHQVEGDDNKSVFRKRYNQKGIIASIKYMRTLLHHELIGLYNVSNVVLDSYYAGGCTTTREALEIGVPVVTLPGKYLGGRWSLAYYNIMGISELIAVDSAQYANIAIKCATDVEYKKYIVCEIKNNIHKLFYRNESIHSWITVLTNILTN